MARSWSKWVWQHGCIKGKVCLTSRCPSLLPADTASTIVSLCATWVWHTAEMLGGGGAHAPSVPTPLPPPWFWRLCHKIEDVFISNCMRQNGLSTCYVVYTVILWKSTSLHTESTYRIVRNFREHKFSRITNKHARKKILFLRQGHDIWPHPLQFSAWKWWPSVCISTSKRQ